MKIHEYQGKEILRNFGVPVPRGIPAFTVQEAVEAAQKLGGPVWVVKAQIHAGGRGKGGGVKLARSIDEVKKLAGEILGMQLKTHQTGPEGQKVRRLLIEDGADIKKEYYVSAVTDRASCPLDWRLFLPEAWDSDLERRGRAKIPEDVHHSPKWQLALDILDELIKWGLARRVVQADGGYGDITAFRLGLEQRELEYVVQVKGTTSAQPASARPAARDYQGRGRPPVPRYRDPPSSLHDLVLANGADAAQLVGWREGDRGPLKSHFVALRVRPANDAQRQPDGVLPERWLLAEWPPGKPEPVKYWLSNLPADTAITSLVAAAKLRWRVEHDYRELKQCLGLDHYEGRSYRGLHHHLTCVTVAHAFLTTCRLQRAGPDTVPPQTAAA